MLKSFRIFILALWCLIACKKEEPPLPSPQPSPPPVVVSDVPACIDLPDPPKPFGWIDSVAAPGKNLFAFNYSNTSSDKIIYMLGGDITGYYPVYTLDVLKGTSTFLAYGSNFLPSFGDNNWLLFSTLDNNIFKIKISGDSLTPVTQDNISLAPQFDYTGKSFFFFKQANFNVGSQIVKVTEKGDVVYTLFNADIPQYCAFKKSNQLLYCQTGGTIATVVQKNLATGEETIHISGPYSSKTGKVHFNNLCMDNTDENFFWSNDDGIFKYNLASKSLDTLFANCKSRSFDYPQISALTGELVFSVHALSTVNNQTLLHTYKAMRSAPKKNTADQVRLFP